MFVVLRPASYDDGRESVGIGEVHLFVGPRFVITVRHEAVPDLSSARAALEAEPQFLTRGEGEGHADPALSERIYRLLAQVIALQRAIGPLPDMVRGLLRGADRYGTGDEVQNRLRNVLDHTIRVTERVDSARSLLENALTVHSTLVTMEQNEAMSFTGHGDTRPPSH